MIFASQTNSAWTAVLLIGLATACHQGWSANIFTLASDMFPRRAVGTVVGFGGFMGGVGGILIAEFAGRVLNRDPSYYLPMFVVGGHALPRRARRHPRARAAARAGAAGG